jgi:hypothetical protein
MVAGDGFRALQCEVFTNSSSYGRRTGRGAHLGGLWVAVVTERRCVMAGSRLQASVMMGRPLVEL